MNGAPYQYIVLHQSCRNHPGVLACQAAHAASESVRSQVSDQTHVVALVAEKSEDLERAAAELAIAGIHHVLIREPDEPYFGAATALGVEPTTDREKVKALLGGFKVLR